MTATAEHSTFNDELDVLRSVLKEADGRPVSFQWRVGSMRHGGYRCTYEWQEYGDQFGRPTFGYVRVGPELEEEAVA